MDHSGEVDQDDIMRARNVLLASGRRTPREEVDAYRILSRVSPATYLPRLARALQRLSHDGGVGEWHPSSLALCEEAVAAARSIDPAEPARADVLYQALDSYQRQLYMAGRRAEGLAVRAEMLSIGRAQAEATGSTTVRGLEEWAAGLSEEGRYAEAADAMTELVTALLPHGPRSGALAWSLLEWIAALHDSGRFDEALAAFESLVDMEAAKAANDNGPMACHLHSLIGCAQMLDANGRGGRAARMRQDALAVLTELANNGERKSWSGYGASFWAILLTMPGADSGDEPSSDGSRPPSGTGVMRWSPDTRQHYFDSRHTLREEVDDLAARAAEDPERHLAELVRLHRVLTVRSAVYWEHHTHLFAQRVGSLFDDGVSMARRLSRHDPVEGPRTLARALIDRSTFHTAAGAFRPALDDFREALCHLDEAT
jgi:tetratricopeptide (TPR) repeat protein